MDIRGIVLTQQNEIACTERPVPVPVCPPDWTGIELANIYIATKVSSYRAVNIHRLHNKDQAANVASENKYFLL